ncbi:MAG: DUF2442 domain-containing protein [Lachnospiraceae bacterium]|nr:DUF2442 domain-containing protein [Lachnospiraceae bacterium]
MDYFPEIVQVLPHHDYTVTVYFHDGKIVLYNMADLLNKPIFEPLRDINVFIGACTILNDTLAWDIGGDKDGSKCIDIDPDTIYQLPAIRKEAI